VECLRGNFYPDLLDERISLLREKIRDVLANLFFASVTRTRAARRFLLH
jgi:hypothetical protein